METEQLRRRFDELSSRAFSRGIWVYSDFLSPAQQSELLCMRLPSPILLEGGYSGAERRMACFGSEEICGCEAFPPFVCIKIQPTSQKFADALTHRDFLGSVMALGVKREMLGDIIVHGNCGYLFCCESVSGYITDSLEQVRHTTVKCTQVEAPPVDSVELPECEEIVISSERSDAVTAEVYSLSRSESKLLAEQGRISINSVVTENPSRILKEHDTVSVRGMGRFIYEGIIRQTKKGKYRANVRIYK